MSTVATAALLEEVHLIREREQDGVAGLAERVGPSGWAALVPHLDLSWVLRRHSEIAKLPLRP